MTHTLSSILLYYTTLRPLAKPAPPTSLHALTGSRHPLKNGYGLWTSRLGRGALALDNADSLPAYGDQWTNMIQPFWTILLLAIAGLSVRDIMGYITITLFVSGIVMFATLLIVGAG